MTGVGVDRISERMKQPLRAARDRYRLATAPARPLPTFMIIGAQRGGTTSMFLYLMQHPRIRGAFYKEVHFFDRYFLRGVRWYRAQFPIVGPRRRRGEGSPIAVGEATPNYLDHPLAADRAAEVVPSAKLIVMLRDPVDRALSSFQLMVKQGKENLTFDEALDKEGERLAGEVDRIRNDPSYKPRSFDRFSYVWRGIYADHLSPWLRRYPRDQFLVIKSEEFYRQPGEVYGQVVDFLGLPPHPLRIYPNYNPLEAATLTPETRHRLEETFSPHNERLYRLIGRDLGWNHRGKEGSR